MKSILIRIVLMASLLAPIQVFLWFATGFVDKEYHDLLLLAEGWVLCEIFYRCKNAEAGKNH